MIININADVRVYASDLILKLYSDASYLSAGQGRSRTGGCFFWEVYQEMANILNSMERSISGVKILS